MKKIALRKILESIPIIGGYIFLRRNARETFESILRKDYSQDLICAMILNQIPDFNKTIEQRELLSILRERYKTEESYKSNCLKYAPKDLQYEYFAIRGAISSFLEQI